jgi:hypothetical protein
MTTTATIATITQAKACTTNLGWITTAGRDGAPVLGVFTMGADNMLAENSSSPLPFTQRTASMGRGARSRRKSKCRCAAAE